MIITCNVRIFPCHFNYFIAQNKIFSAFPQRPVRDSREERILFRQARQFLRNEVLGMKLKAGESAGFVSASLAVVNFWKARLAPSFCL
jgi:hypothetical protein